MCHSSISIPFLQLDVFFYLFCFFAFLLFFASVFWSPQILLPVPNNNIQGVLICH